MNVVTAKLSDLATKIQSIFQKRGIVSGDGLENLLSDMQSKIADANVQYDDVQSQILPLTPQSYNSDANGTKTTLKNAKLNLQIGVNDIKAAFEDARSIMEALRSGAHGNYPTPTPIPTQ
jgi:hypothetical protein